MIKYGALFTCDRCGETKFVEESAEYRVHDGKYLCPDCTELYNKMMNNFFAPEVKRPINLED